MVGNFLMAVMTPGWLLRGVRCGNGQVEFVLKLPDEATEFACDGDDDFVLAFAPRLELDVAGVEPVLHAPGEFFNFFALSLLPAT